MHLFQATSISSIDLNADSSQAKIYISTQGNASQKRQMVIWLAENVDADVIVLDVELPTITASIFLAEESLSSIRSLRDPALFSESNVPLFGVLGT
jgi:hypothetical protein